MTVYYEIEDHGIIRAEIDVAPFSEWTAESCADHYYYNHDGWEWMDEDDSFVVSLYEALDSIEPYCKVKINLHRTVSFSGEIITQENKE